jgi:hypothetical protein
MRGKDWPTEPIDGSSPESTARRVNAHDVNWANSTGRRNTSMRRCRYGAATGVDNCSNGEARNAIAWSPTGGEA